MNDKSKIKPTAGLSQTCPHNSQVSCGNCRLSKICIPLALETTEIDQLDEIVQRGRPLRKGQHLFRQGQAFGSIFAVRSGSFKSYSVNDEGVEQVSGFYLPGEIMGLDGISMSRHVNSVVAYETSSICEIPFAELESLTQQIPSLQRHFFQLMSQEIVEDQRLITLLSKNTAGQRVAAFLLSLSARYARQQLSSVAFRIPMSRQDMANYLGLTVETISRVLSKYKKQGILMVANREIAIVNVEALRAAAEKYTVEEGLSLTDTRVVAG